MEKRPELNTKISLQDFTDFYWYKEELLEFCRAENLDKQGGKLALTERIQHYLETGERKNNKVPVSKNTSLFDWSNENLTAATIISDNYKNTENVRAFFTERIGKKFKFNVKFMNWMKSARNKTLGDAIEKWIDISDEKRKDNSPKDIAPQFEYNAYLRDFLKDNPLLSREKAIDCWKMKKLLRGDNKYNKSDLALISA